MNNSGTINTFPVKVRLDRKLTANLFVPHEVLIGLFADFYEPAERTLLPVIYNSGDRVLELGCGMGLITLILGSRCEFVLGLEALPDYAEVARANAGSNNLSNVIILSVMGHTLNGEADFRYRNPPYSSSAVLDRIGMEEATDNIITVPTIDVNELIDQHSINAIHLDVEGSELELIPHILSGSNIASVNKISWETHTHIIGVDGNNRLFYALMDTGFEPVVISGAYFFPTRCYTIAFARPPLADEMRHRQEYIGDTTVVDLEDFRHWLGEIKI